VKHVLITGATSGLGLASARVLCERGAHVILATRNPEKTEAVVRALTGSVSHVPLDLSSQASVRDAAKRVLDRYERLDVLMNNAGVIGVPFARTVDGWESHFATNHLGHFTLTNLLLPLLLGTPGSRVVVVSSSMHKLGRIDRDDLLWHTTRYRPWHAYARSKLANLLFLRELDRRLAATRSGTIAVGAHPGVTPTKPKDATTFFGRALMAVVGQPMEMGVLPQIHAATADVPRGTYWGPARWAELKGPPGPAKPSRRARNDADARWLWERSAELTGVDAF
jgi:NAD(P)-dependent dehydrogenase (short-subunit alcohol dehydrogenase family)